MIVRDWFHQLSRGDSKVLDHFFDLQLSLKTYPEGLDRNVFLNNSDKQFEQLKNEVYHHPLESMLKREAEDELEKRFGQNEIKHTEDKLYKLETGHIRLFDRVEIHKLQSQMQSLFGTECQVLGDFIYPPGGFRSWHTNKYDVPKNNSSVWAIFFVFTEEENASFFKFINPESGRLITAWDKCACANIFRVSRDPVVWHCIKAETTTRWSVGFHLPNYWESIVYSK